MTYLRYALGIALLVLVLLTVAAGGGLWWALRADDGAAWLLARVPGLVIGDGRGALWGDYAAARVQLALPGGGRIELADAEWRGLRAERAPWAPWRARLVVDELRARRVDVVLPGAGPAASKQVPGSLRLPLEIEVRTLRVGELQLAPLGDTPLRNLRARLHLGSVHGALHRIDGIAFERDRVAATGSLVIAADAPFILVADAEAAQPAAERTPAWEARATLDGPLATPVLTATLRSKPDATLDLRTLLRPFDAWPLGVLDARLHALDLSAFASGAPATALSGDVHAETRGMDQPARIHAALVNADAGRWNDGRLPVRQLTLDLHGRPGDPHTLELRQFAAEFGTRAHTGGQLAGHGHWTPQRWTLDATLTALQPALLDARAPAMTLSGPVAATGEDFDAGLERATLGLRAKWSGQFADRGPARAATLSLDASVSWLLVELRQAHAVAGNTRASLAGSAARVAAGAPWRLRGRGTLAGFDPATWWPGPETSAWRRGPHRLDAGGDVDAWWMPSASPHPAWRGQAQLVLRNSVFAGVPVAGELSLRGGADVLATLKLDAAGNRLVADGRLAGAHGGTGDHWQLTLAAPALDRVAPLWRLVAPAGEEAMKGSLSAQATVDGRWPAIATRGRIDAGDVVAGTSRLQRLQASWEIDGRGDDAAIDLQATLARLDSSRATAQGLPPIESGELRVSGTMQSHHIALKAESRALPPAWAATLQPAAKEEPAGRARSAVAIEAQGGVLHATSRGAAWPWIGWRGRLQRIDLHGMPADAPPWLHTQDVDIELHWAEGPLRAALQPGRLELLGTALRWERLAWQAAAGRRPMQLEARAVLEPLQVAPLLARLQPEAGWRGDLALAGHLALHGEPAFGADIVLERSGGDLSLADDTGHTQVLGISDLRLALDVRDGVWTFTQALAGRALGAGAGALVARVPSRAAWPTADTPIDGVLDLQVANLDAWSAWLPAGWRLSGALRTGVGIGGSLGAPQYTGDVTGSAIGVRNVLLGVDVRDGDIAIALRGKRARIERLAARAGDGSLRLDGEAAFGAAPQALLRLQAERFQLLGRRDRRIVASGQAQLQLDPDTLALDGRFTVDEGLVDFTQSTAPRRPDDFVVVRRGDTRRAEPAAARSSRTGARSVKLDLAVSLGEHLRLRGHGLDTGLRGDLQVSSPNNRIALTGAVRAVDGSYQAYGQKLDITRGEILFSGPFDNPRLDIEATRPNLDVRVCVRVNGMATDPRVHLFSEPEMTEMDKLSWLVLGRARDSSGSDDTALLQRAAVSLLAGESGGGVTRRLGLDEVSVRQGDGDVHDTVVSLGKQLSQRWYVGYARSLDATEGSWQLIYRVAQRFTLRAQSGADSAVDVIWTWRWQ